MSENKRGPFVNLIKKAVGLPTGSSSCCGTAPAEGGAKTQETVNSCCGSAPAQASTSSCCGSESTNAQTSDNCCG